MTDVEQLKDLYKNIVNETSDDTKSLIIKFNELYVNLRTKYINEGIYFTGAPIEMYKRKINQLLNKTSESNSKFSDLELLKDEYEKHFSRLKPYRPIPIEPKNSYLTLSTLLEILNTHNKKILLKTIRDRIDFLELELYKRGYFVEEERDKNNQTIGVFFVKNSNKRIEYLSHKENKNTFECLKWHGEQTQLMELIKALMVTKILRGDQKDIVESLCAVFDFQIKHPSKTLNDIKNRNIGSETLFLDKLKESLFNHFQEKNRR